MRKINYYSLALLSALTVFGCSQNDLFEASQNSNNAISFSTQTNKQTRGLIIDRTNSTNYYFGVFAYYTEQNPIFVENEVKPNFMSNQKVEYSTEGGSWSYSPMKYWPNNDGDMISFFAYMPMGKSLNGGVGSTSASIGEHNLPIISFNQDFSDLTKMVDLVVAQKTDQYKQTNDVIIPFKHVLSRLNFSAQIDENLNEENNTMVFIKDFKFVKNDNLYSTAKYQQKVNKDNNGIGEWKYDGAEKINGNLNISGILNLSEGNFGDYTYNSEKGKAIPLSQTRFTPVSLFQDNQYLFLIPPSNQGIVEDNSIMVELTYDIVTQDNQIGDEGQHYSKTTTTTTISLPKAILKPCTAYNIIFTIGLENVKLTANVEDWTKANDIYAPSTDLTVNLNDATTSFTSSINTLNAIKKEHANTNCFSINVLNDINKNISIDLNYDLTYFKNFSLGDQIIIKDTRSKINNVSFINLPYGWTYEYDSTLKYGILKLKGITMNDYCQWNAGYHMKSNETSTEWGTSSAVFDNTAFESNDIKDGLCKKSASFSDVVNYLNGGVYWDNDEDGDNKMTYWVLGVKHHAGIWVKKESVLRDENQWNDNNEYDRNGKNVAPTALDNEDQSGIRTSKNYFFIPALGQCYTGGPGFVGQQGFYWLSTMADNDTKGIQYAHRLYFNNTQVVLNIFQRYQGIVPLIKQ